MNDMFHANTDAAPRRSSSALAANADQILAFAEALFCYATAGNRVSLRSFYEDGSRPQSCRDLLLDDSGLARLAGCAADVATDAANDALPVVFCPPVATFRPDTSRAGEGDLAEGLVLSVECDETPQEAHEYLVGLLGRPTVVVASGGEWTDPSTGEIQSKRHLHWRLSEPTRNRDEHARLKLARQLAAALVGGDPSAGPLVHPMRWPGSWHRKGSPRLASITEQTSSAEIELSEALEKLVEAAQARGLVATPGADETLPDLSAVDLRAADEGDIAAALSHIPNPDLPWHAWNRIGMAAWAATGGSERGLDAFMAWSGQSAKHDPVATGHRWRHYRTSPPDRIGGGTIFWEAERAAPGWRRPGLAGAPTTAEEAAMPEVEPIDLWARFQPPELPEGLLPPAIEVFARTQAELMGTAPAGIAMAALAACAASIPDDIKIQVKRHDPDWLESARLWVLLVGEPSTKKSPILRAAVGPVAAIDGQLFRAWLKATSDYAALSKEEAKGKPRPKQVRLRVEDATVESLQEVLKDSTQGLLSLQDEMVAFFGRMDAYNGGPRGAGKDRGFFLQAYNGGQYANNRVGRAFLIENLSLTILGGIQPDAIRKIAADSVDDGLLQRFCPVVLRPATTGKDEPVPTEVEAYRTLIDRLYRLRDSLCGITETLEFDDGAQAIRRELEADHLALMKLETINRKLAAHIGKLDGLFARLCLAWHCIEHAHMPMPPRYVEEATARRVAKFMRGFLLGQAFAFYNGTLALSDDHDELAAVASHILAKRLNFIRPSDVGRSRRHLRNLDVHSVEKLLGQLEALGWLFQVPADKPPYTRRWLVNPRCHELFADRAKQEAARLAEAHATIRAEYGGGTSR